MKVDIPDITIDIIIEGDDKPKEGRLEEHTCLWVDLNGNYIELPRQFLDFVLMERGEEIQQEARSQRARNKRVERRFRRDLSYCLR